MQVQPVQQVQPPASMLPAEGQLPGQQDVSGSAGAQDTIYLCNFRVSVDGEWLCLKELEDVELDPAADNPALSPAFSSPSPDDPPPMLLGMLSKDSQSSQSCRKSGKLGESRQKNKGRGNQAKDVEIKLTVRGK